MKQSDGYLTTDDGVRLFFQKAGTGPQTVIVANAIYLFDDFKRLAEGRTLISYDLRNRGRSDEVSDVSKLARGVHQDVDDLEAVRRYFGVEQVDVIGHSYIGLMVALYAMKYPAHVRRIVQIGPMQLDLGKQYPPHLTCADAVQRGVFAKLTEMQKESPSGDSIERCWKSWSVLRPLYVADPANVDKIAHWGFCDLPTERTMLKHFNENIVPSIGSLELSADQMAQLKAPALTIHGRMDRSAPYGGGRDWALRLPNARLLTVENAGHVPWLETPDLVFTSISTFLDGAWPEAAHKAESLEAKD